MLWENVLFVIIQIASLNSNFIELNLVVDIQRASLDFQSSVIEWLYKAGITGQ